MITEPQAKVSWAQSLRNTDHHTLAIRYLTLSLIAVAAGTLMSLVMRIHLVYPDRVLPLWGPIKPEDYLALVTLHGTLMLFFVLTLAPQAGFGSLILPSQVGARRMAFPALNAAAFWLFALALATLLSSSFVQGGAAISGWTAYPPLSAVPAAGPGQGLGMDLWLASIGIFAIASIFSAINQLATIVAHRCPGMTWQRLPLTVWAWFTAAILSIIAFSVLLAALILLFADRHAGTSFFLPAGDLVNGTLHGGLSATAGSGSPLLWLHLFWFFGHPEVYIAILPGMGLTSMILANFARRRVFGYNIMIATTLLIGFLGILVWGHHMFVAGLNPFASTAFSISTMAIAIPSAAKVLSWLATIWRSRPEYSTPMLFALGFVSLFIAGGLTGPILAQPILDQFLHNTYFVVAHFHLIMAMAGMFGLFAATYYWFPLLSLAATGHARRMSEPLGRWHFWLTLVFAYLTFLPMHFAGLIGNPRHYSQLNGIPNSAASDLLAHALPWQRHITWSAIILASAQLLFLINVFRSLYRGTLAPENPWQATTLEWHPAFRAQDRAQDRTQDPTQDRTPILASLSHAPSEPPVKIPASNQNIAVFRSPCHYFHAQSPQDFLPQWLANEKPE